MLAMLCSYHISSLHTQSPTYVKNSHEYSSFGLDSHDIDSMLNSHAHSLLDSDFMNGLKDRQILAIGNITNNTNEDIDIELLARKLTREIAKSKKLILTNAITGSGAKADTMLRDTRNLDERFNPYTTQENGTLDAPRYSLSGKLIARTKPIDSMLRVDYTLLLTLTDLHNGRVVWDNEESISKVLSKEMAQKFMTTSQHADNKDTQDADNIVRMQQECINNNAKKCNELGILYLRKQDYTKAKEYYSRACDGKYTSGCFNLGGMYSNGEGVQQDFFKAKEYYSKGCDLGDNWSCGTLGNMYLEGKGVRQDYLKAKEYYTKACNGKGAVGCYNLGAMYNTGQGVRQNFATAKEYFGKACDLGYQNGCDAYKELNQAGH